jgi:hypothetical protein
MTTPDYSTLVARQRECSLSGTTRPTAWLGVTKHVLERRIESKFMP